MNFDFEQFAKELHASFSDHFNLDEVRGILYLDDDGYKKSIPNSVGKRLLLNHIVIKGIKGDGESFLYNRILLSGVSMWVASNLKGKSTVFKAIKYALTGKENFTPQMKSWIKLIQLQFTIDESLYTVQLDLSTTQLKAYIFAIKINDLNENSIPVESFRSKDSFSDYMQNLFFEKFDYYPIKKVQATQSSVNLSDADLSWATYYSSIYQQSKDYGNLAMGNQNGAVFQMLLGLEFTYSIYALEVKFKKLERELNIEDGKANLESSFDIEKLKENLSGIQEKISDLKNNTVKEKLHLLQTNLQSLTNVREIQRKRKLEVEMQNFNFQSNSIASNRIIHEKRNLVKDTQKDIIKLKKLVIEYREHIESGIFFNNLEVTECPHCDHKVEREKIVKEKETNICMLCDHEKITDSEDFIIWENRIIECQKDIEKYESILGKESDSLKAITIEAEEVFSGINILTIENDKLQKSIDQLDNNIVQVESEVDELIKDTSTTYLTDFEKLLQEKITIERDIRAAEQSIAKKNDQKLSKKVELLKFAHQYLIDKRGEIGRQVLSDLQDIMLNQLHALGLNNYTKVVVKPDNFVVYYYQDDVMSSFKDISEGEQLRAKLALYLSLIELDLEKGLGRHPRLIILDSPTKEEGDEFFVEGLKNSLLHIEEKFGDKVQVLVGTANRELQSIISDPNKLESRDTGVFMF